jgi:hypothetical protein
MLLDNGAADRQPYAHAFRLGREEGIEHPLDIFRLDSDAGILYRNEYLVGPVLPRSYQQFATAVGHGTHGLDAVHQKIQYNLLQLDAVAMDWRKR